MARERLLVWSALYLVFGERTDGLMDTTKSWITTHEEQVMVTSAFVLGILMCVDALFALL